jgi:peptide/nickel transport system ATP-binding protein
LGSGHDILPVEMNDQPLPAPVLDVSDLGVALRAHRRSVQALRGISFEIGRGEVLGLVGESGAGKSITGAAIVGLLPPGGTVSSGEIRLSGLRLDSLSPAAMRSIRGKRIGMIFQDPSTSLDPLMTVGEQIVETLTTHLHLDRRRARERAAVLLADTGIDDAASRLECYPHEFSGGMRQRVVIALALAGEPELVIADEPTTALDVSVQAQIIALLTRLCRDRRVAMLLVTHDMGVIAKAADRVAVMYAGRIVEIGDVADVLHRPRHPYTQGLMRSIPPLSYRPERLVQIPGAMPQLTAIPAGCAFNPRCASVLPACRTQMPDLRAVEAGTVACHLYGAPAERVR